jgi:hypothetical protein
MVEEASQLEDERGQVSPEQHKNAHLGFLYSLILADSDFGHLVPQLTKIAGHRAVASQDVPGVAKLVSKLAAEIGIRTSLLAWAAIMWANEAEAHPYEIKGSADWFDLPAHLQDERSELRKDLHGLSNDIEAALKGSGLDPESAVRIAAERASTLTRRLRILEKRIQGVKQRRSKLLTDLRTYQIEAYYLRRIRRKKIDDAKVLQLIQHALGDSTYLTSHRRVPTQKTLYDWADAVERIVDAFAQE